MRAIPQFHGIDAVFPFQVLSGIPIVTPYNILLSTGPTWRGEPFITVALCDAQCF